MTKTPPKKKRGFAAISPERQREIASMGGRAVRPENRAYSRDPDLARRSAQKGGNAPHVSRGGCPIKEKIEIWKGREEALIRRMAISGKSLVEAREAIGSEMTIPAFREKCRRKDILFQSTRPPVTPTKPPQRARYT